MSQQDYEIVMGLEVHCELNTKSKIFCSCSTEFGSDPNENTCPVCMGLPGAVPVLNEEVVNKAIKAGLATNCEITRRGRQERKNYFYPDLGRGYQISQGDNPICHDGYLDIETSEGSKRIRIERIHIEEDAGKLVHEEGVGSLVDNNRSSMPLVEIVSKPDLNSAEEVIAYLQKLRAHMIYAGVSEAKMNEGSFRADVNLSVRKKGDEKLGTRVEMKNMNSYQSIKSAIEYEANRQINALEKGEELFQETRGYNQDTKKTFSMRRKETATDYRYTPDPDLQPIVISDDMIESIRKDMPELPDERKNRYVKEFKITEYDAEKLVTSQELAEFFEKASKGVEDSKLVSNLITTEIFRLADLENFKVPFEASKLTEVVKNLESGKINLSAAKKIIDAIWNDPSIDISSYIKSEDLEQISDKNELSAILDDVLAKNKKAVEEYKSGNEKAVQSIIGGVMGATRGKANPQVIIELIKEKI